jgi:hypothetical protein
MSELKFKTMTGAVAIEQAARDLEDEYLPRRPPGKKASNSAWLRLGFGIADDTGASDEDATTDRAATDAAVRGAAGKGKVKILSSLYDEGQWDPWRCRLSIEASAEGGYLLGLLKNFLVHLSWYPSLAEEQESLALQELVSAEDAAPRGQESGQVALAKSPLSRELTQRTCLLANLLYVNSPMAARVLSAAAEEMVVFRGNVFKPVRRYPDKPFPFTLDTLYVKRYITERESERMKYFPDSRELYLPGAEDPTPTSPEYQVTLPRECRNGSLIPLTAEYFCFVYPCPEMPRGGYLYIAADEKPLCVNKGSRDAGQQAFAFGEPIDLSAEATQHIHDNLHDLSPDDPYRRRGAVQFAWVMAVPGIELSLGGFAYVFSDHKMNRIFPLKAAGEVTRMADLSWYVNAHVLGVQTSGEELERKIAPPGEDKAKPVAIMRITAPDVLHPMMLHALAFTPREDALDTDVAKAISYAAFRRALPFYIQQLILDIGSALGLFYMTWEVHQLTDKGGDSWNFGEGDNWLNACVYALVAAVFFKNVYEEIRKFIGFWKCRWMRDYVCLNTLKNLFSMCCVAALLILLACGGHQNDQGYLRTLLAVAGFFKWIKIVTYFRGILTLELGPKFLPISYTLQAGLSFLVVMAFFILAAWHAFYSLRPEYEGWTYMFSMTYNLGFLGDFDMDNLLSPSGNAGVSSWAWVQQIAFAVSAMLVTVMLTNIYIGVMGSAYDHFHGKAQVLFVRARASICLDIFMQYGSSWGAMFGGRDARFQDEYVWFCRADSDYEDANDSGWVSSVYNMQHELKGQIESLSRHMKELSGPQGQQAPGAVGAGARTWSVGDARPFRPSSAPPRPSLV